ncbi:MAG: zinc ribbon domain-containing protein [Tannerellaceae bacterium]|jgi:hypothetical protein|nr:zinc ribbon domain-containing protein [Tannerellaceae bacterium]
MPRANKFCQSCSIPLKKDPEGGGTNADGSRNPKYCSYCYQKGAFTFSGTAEEMQKKCMHIMMSNGTPKFMAWLFTRPIKKLERWA